MSTAGSSRTCSASCSRAGVDYGRPDPRRVSRRRRLASDEMMGRVASPPGPDRRVSDNSPGSGKFVGPAWIKFPVFR
jgi:hypothetical protein